MDDTYNHQFKLSGKVSVWLEHVTDFNELLLSGDYWKRKVDELSKESLCYGRITMKDIHYSVWKKFLLILAYEFCLFLA
jgi:hypothetical protein